VTPSALKILYVCGADSGTCRSRKEALIRLGHDVRLIALLPEIRRFREFFFKVYSRTLRGPAVTRFNARVREAAREARYDWIWVDKGIHLFPGTVRGLRELGNFLVHHLTDDFLNPKHAIMYRYYKEAAPWYHAHLTSNAFNVDELGEFGAECVIRTDLGYDPHLCMPGGVPPAPQNRFEADAVFVGFWRPHLDEYLLPLVRSGAVLSAWGARWRRSPFRRDYLGYAHFRPCPDEDYAAVIAGAKIALCFLARENRNLSTGRSFEIPAIGAFMLGERTGEHQALYEEGKEAEFFGSPEELVEKATFYLKHDALRAQIARAGHKRALTSGYSYEDRIRGDISRLASVYEKFTALGRKR
jgi:hypothetical protein